MIFTMKKTEIYESPEVEIFEVIAEGVLCTSGWADDSDDVELL